MKPKHADDGMNCPLWKKACIKVCHACEFWDHIRGKHPQTGADMDHWACTMKMQTYLSIENTMVARQVVSSVDALRKEVHTNADTAMVSAIGVLNHKMDAAQQIAAQPSQKLLEN